MVNVVYSNTSHFCWDSQLHVYLRKTGRSITKVEAGAKKKLLKPQSTQTAQNKYNRGQTRWPEHDIQLDKRGVMYTSLSLVNKTTTKNRRTMPRAPKSKLSGSTESFLKTFPQLHR